MSIEQKIAELLEDSIKLKALNLQEADETKKKSKKEEADESDEEEASEDDKEEAGGSDEEEASEDDKPKFDFSKLKKKSVKEELDLEDYTLEELEDFMVSEEFEQLDELSKKTLGSYIKKASAERSDRAWEIGKGDGESGFDKIGNSKNNSKHAAFLSAIEKKRGKGISKATDKLTKEEYDVQEDVDALLFGEDLSEEFREKASVIFEAAVMSRVNAEFATLEEELTEAYQERLDEEMKSIHEEMEDKVDGYLGYVAEQWMKENELAIKQSLKSEILEGFVEGMKNLFQEHYIDVPDEQFDAVGDLHEQIENLETKLDESLEYNVEMRTQIATMTRDSLVEDFCKELTDTEIEKFKSLSEELTYSSQDSFTSKLEIIKENYFSKTTGKSAASVVSDKPVQLTEELTNIDQNVARYLDTFNRIKI
jgi:hypothetical protein